MTTESRLSPLPDDDDWERLPRDLQDAVDALAIDEVRHEKAEALDLESVLSAED